MLKKFVSLIVVLSIVLLLAACQSGQVNDAYDKIRIGVILPLSGDNELAATQIRNGIDLAVENINKKGGINGRMVALMVKNSKGNAETAEILMRDMIENDNVIAVIGGYSDEESLALSAVAEELKIPYVASAAMCDELGEFTEYTFRTNVNLSQQAGAVIYHLYFLKKYKKIAILIDKEAVDNTNRTLGVRCSEFLSYHSQQTAVTLLYQPNSKDFTPQIELLVRGDFDAVIVPASVWDTIRFIRQSRDNGYAGTIVGFHNLNCDNFQTMGDLRGDIYFTSSYSVNNESRYNSKFIEQYRKKYDRTPNDLSATAYDAVFLVAKGLRDNYTSDMVAYTLRNSPTYPSVCGDMVLNSKKKVLHPVYLYRKTANGAAFEKEISAYSLRKFKDLK